MNYDIIKQIAFKKGFSLPLLAKEVGVTKTGLYKMISNKSMTVENLERISTVLETPIDVFISDSYTPPEDTKQAELQLRITKIETALTALNIL